VDLERLQKENHRLRQDIQELEHKVRNQQNKYVTEVEYLKKRVFLIVIAELRVGRSDGKT
jgi:cell division septum initiation protein DivIVA